MRGNIYGIITSIEEFIEKKTCFSYGETFVFAKDSCNVFLQNVYHAVEG